MAQTIQITPNGNLQSGYNSIYYGISSTNSANDQFRYVIDVMSGGTDVQFVERFLVAPRPEDGWGVINLQKYLATYLGYNLSADTVGFAPASGHAFTYKIFFGETFPYWSFTDNYFQSGNVGFSGIAEHNLSIGDEIIVQQDSGYVNESYQGIATVTEIVSPYIIKTNKPWAENTPVNAGRIYKSNGLPFITTGITSGDSQVAVSSVLTRNETSIPSVMDQFRMVGSNNKFLTNSPSTFRMQRQSTALVSIFNKTGLSDFAYIRTYDFNNNSLGLYRLSNVFNTINDLNEGKVIHLGIGAKNLENTPASMVTVIEGAYPIIDADVASYDYFTSDGSFSSETRTIEISCTPTVRENFEMLFIDRFGSWFSFNFSMNSKEFHKIDRKTYNRINQVLNSGTDQYFNPQNRGYSVYNTDIKSSYEISTDYLTDEESEYFMNLLQSPEVYHIDSEYGALPVILNSGNYEQQKNIDGLVSYTIKFQYAYSESIQQF